MNKWLLMFCYLLSVNVMYSQITLTLEITDKSQDFIENNISYKPQQSSVFNIQKELFTIITNLQGKGYIAASLDSLVMLDSTKYKAQIFTGQRFKWTKLNKGNVADVFLTQIGFKEKLYENKPFKVEDIQKIQLNLLRYCENNGYPFASVGLKNIIIKNGKVSATLHLEKRRLIFINEVKMEESEANISEVYLRNYLGLKRGEIYNESKIKAITNRIRELPFLQEKRKVAIEFVENQANIYLFLKAKKASRFDFLVGFLPNNDQTGRLMFTGSLQAQLQNPFGTGKTFAVDWQQLRPETSKFEAEFVYPYILGLPFGMDTKLHIYRRDSTYRDVNYDIGVQYLLQGNNYFKVFAHNISSSLLNFDVDKVFNTRTLPSVLDVRNSTFGVEYHTEKLDYRFNPQKGFEITLRGGAGNKRILENNQITSLSDDSDPDFDFSSLYDAIKLRTFQLRVENTIATYIPLFTRGVVKTALQGGYIYTKDELYQNEVFRIGGNRILRGFDEESIFASLYGVLTLEYRFIISQNSYLYAFADGAYLQNQSADSNIKDTPYGVGVGMTVETAAGIIGISIAVGSQQDNPFDVRSSKIHFGYVNYF